MNKTTEDQFVPPQAAAITIATALGKAWAAAIVRRPDGGIQTQAAVLNPADGIDGQMQRFIAQVGGGVEMPILAGLEASQIRFLSLTLPPADAAKLPRLIAAQAEAKLPLSADQLHLAWQLSPTAHGWDCTVAAVRRDATAAIGSLDEKLAALTPDAAGMGLFVRAFFAAVPPTFLLLRRRADGVLLARFEGDVMTHCAIVPVEAEPMTIQEIQLEMQAIAPRSLPVCLWPNHTPLMQNITAMLSQAGWQVQTLSPDAAAIDAAGLTAEWSSGELSAEATGLAMLGLAGAGEGFDFLQSRRAAAPQKAARQQRRRRLKSLAIVGVLMLVCLAAHYIGLKMRVGQLRGELAAQTDGLSAKTILQRQAYRQSVARIRLDVLELLMTIQDSRDGLLLDAIEFEAGKPIRLTASAGGYDQVYGFQKRLAERVGVSGVQLIDPRLDDKTGQVRFTLQFHYHYYTKSKQ